MDGKREAVRLPFAVIRVLTENNYFHLIERTQLERAENILGRRIHRAVFIFFFHKSGEVGKIRLFKLCREARLPRFVNFHFHNSSML